MVTRQDVIRAAQDPINYERALWRSALGLVSGQITAGGAIASEALAAGKIVSLFDASGAGAQLADNTDDTKQADGFSLDDYAPGDEVTLGLPGQVIAGLSGLTPGGLCWLGTAGGVTQAIPTGAGVWRQEIGRAIDATSMIFAPKDGEKL